MAPGEKHGLSYNTENYLLISCLVYRGNPSLSNLPQPAQVLDPEKQADLLDSLRICLLQFSTLLVEHAPHHIHDNNKSRNSKLRRLMTFAWPCLLPKACVDPACKYSGHLLLAHIIAKFAIHKKIVLQVRRPSGAGGPA